jgi:hypothetical protein
MSFPSEVLETVTSTEDFVNRFNINKPLLFNARVHQCMVEGKNLGVRVLKNSLRGMASHHDWQLTQVAIPHLHESSTPSGEHSNGKTTCTGQGQPSSSIMFARRAHPRHCDASFSEISALLV